MSIPAQLEGLRRSPEAAAVEAIKTTNVRTKPTLQVLQEEIQEARRKMANGECDLLPHSTIE